MQHLQPNGETGGCELISEDEHGRSEKFIEANNQVVDVDTRPLNQLSVTLELWLLINKYNYTNVIERSSPPSWTAS